MYKNTDSAETAIGIENISDFKIVSNGGHTSMLMTVCEGMTTELYISNLKDGKWSTPEHFTNLKKQIRNYSPFMYADGSVCVAVTASEVNEIKNEDDPLYGTTSMYVLNQCEYRDISTSYLYYDNEKVMPGAQIDLLFDVNNNQSEILKSVNVKITNDNGDILSEQKVSCNIEAFGNEELSVKYRLPSELTYSKLNLTVGIDNEEVDYTNNSSETYIGYANIKMSDIDCVVNSNNTADIKASVTNNGYSKAENLVINIYHGNVNSTLLKTINCNELAVGDRFDISYTYPAELMVSTDDDKMNGVYIEVSSDTEESNYADNSAKAAFDSYGYDIPGNLEKGTDYETAGVNVEYDGREHSISFTAMNNASGAAIEFSKDGETYNAVNPGFKDVGEYTVYYRISKDRWNTVTGSETVKITPKTAELVWSGFEERDYDGTASNVTAAVSNLIGEDVCAVTVEGGNKTEAGTHTAIAVELSNSNYILPENVKQEYTIKGVASSPNPAETAVPTETPTINPSIEPTEKPIETAKPSMTPTETPIETAKPSVTPTVMPSTIPTEKPIETAKPTTDPTKTPIKTENPIEPSEKPMETIKPSLEPTISPIPSETSRPDTTQTPELTDTVTVLGKYKGNIKVKKAAEGNKAIFTVSSVSDTNILDGIILFVAQYDSTGKMTGVKIARGTVSDNSLVIEADIPASDRYKFMLWDKDNTPVIKAVTEI